ncbi:MAG: polysaccharide deacetylase [Firmicutes bacterium]|nr:polysaccharide deacetylase [Bacillota bacterium]
MRKTSKNRRLFIVILCVVMILGAMPVTASAASQTKQDMEAEVLHELNLLAGSPTGFKLHLKLSRVEAITMLIHMMGEDEAVLNGTFSHPFTDVPDWAQNFVGYAYENKLTSGVSDTLFGSSQDCKQEQYLTFLLRAIGYSDARGEFVWNNPYELAKQVGLIDSAVPLQRFSRGDMVSASYRALSAKLHTVTEAKPTGGAIAGDEVTSDGAITLKDRLINKGMFTQAVYDTAMADYQKGPKTVKAVYLTFDDGPSTKVTPRILNILKENGVPATFFVLGSRVDANPEIVRREYQEGHKVANHGYSHDYNYLYASTENLLKDINRGNAAIDRALGFSYGNRVFRFPSGSHGKNAAFKNAVKNAGHIYYDWTSSGEDAVNPKGSSAQFILNSTINTIWGDRNNVIVLLHDTNAKGTTADALPQIIKYFRDNGYEFKTL